MIEDGVHPRWQKSSFCNSDGCVEIAAVDEGFWVRDSKLGDASPVLKFDSDEWQALRRGILAGEL